MNHRWTAKHGSGFPHSEFATKSGIGCLNAGCGVRRRLMPRGKRGGLVEQVSLDGGVTWVRYKTGCAPCAGERR
jgi:hypothetical protein